LEALGINPGFLVAQIVNFLVIFALLAVVWDRIVNMLENRKRRIAEGLEIARKAEGKLASAQAEYEARMAQAEEEARKRVEEALARAGEAAKAIRAEAEEEAQRIRTRAGEDGVAERDRILADMRGQVAALAIAAAHRLVGEAMSEARERALVADFFAKVPADVKEMGGQVVEVTSALPLTDEEKNRAQAEIGASEVTFKVDPGILGGLIVRAGNVVVDGSYADQLGQMAQQLQ
jgi:F-type H+-transporting ATPase subunit b